MNIFLKILTGGLMIFLYGLVLSLLTVTFTKLSELSKEKRISKTKSLFYKIIFWAYIFFLCLLASSVVFFIKKGDVLN